MILCKPKILLMKEKRNMVLMVYYNFFCIVCRWIHTPPVNQHFTETLLELMWKCWSTQEVLCAPRRSMWMNTKQLLLLNTAAIALLRCAELDLKCYYFWNELSVYFDCLLCYLVIVRIKWRLYLGRFQSASFTQNE